MLGEPVRRCTTRDAALSPMAFDLIVVADLLEHVADDRALLAEMARC